MVDAVLGGEGLERVAELAAEAAGGPVAIVVPRHDVAVAFPADGAGAGARRAAALRRRAGRGTGRRRCPTALVAEAPIAVGRRDARRRRAVRTGAPARRRAEAHEFLHLAAVASLTEVAVEQAKEEVEQNVRGSFLEDLRSRPDIEPRDIVRRAARLGCDLSRGAVILCAELTTDRPRHVVATIAGEVPGRARPAHGRPRVRAAARGRRRRRARGDARARRAGSRRGCSATARRRCRASTRTPAELPRAIQEAELVLDVLRQSDAPIAEDIGTGTYRLLFRVLASHPEEVRSFYEDTVAPIVRYDDQYRTDLVGTLESYLDQNCNMNATAAAIYAHRHTVAYRLERVKELTGLDPMQSEDRERLGLGPEGLPHHRAAAAEVAQSAR